MLVSDPRTRFQGVMITTVLILVLVDVGLGHDRQAWFDPALLVLILVLVDVGLGPPAALCGEVQAGVLILVLVDVGLGHSLL